MRIVSRCCLTIVAADERVIVVRLIALRRLPAPRGLNLATMLGSLAAELGR